MKCLSYSEASTLSATLDHYYFHKCLDLTETYNILFKCAVHRKMQTSHVALERLPPRPFREKWIACWNSNAFIKWNPWLFHQNAKRSLVISLHLQTDSIFKKEACVLLFLGSAQCLDLSSFCTVLLSWKMPVWLGSHSESQTGSSYVPPIKLSSPAFIPAKEVQTEIKLHYS